MTVIYPYSLIDVPYAERINIKLPLVRKLIETQFFEWKNLSIRPVKLNGWCNNNFRLGQNMLIKLPTAKRYVRNFSEIERNHQNLRILSEQLPLAIPIPIPVIVDYEQDSL